jgi:hypothetical protein
MCGGACEWRVLRDDLREASGVWIIGGRVATRNCQAVSPAIISRGSVSNRIRNVKERTIPKDPSVAS